MVSIMNDLFKLIKGMELPDFRKTQDTIHNMQWLFKNLGRFNTTHPNYEKAMAILGNLTGHEKA